MLPWDVLEHCAEWRLWPSKTARALLGNHQHGVEQVDVGGSIDSVDVAFQTGQGMLNASMEKGWIAYA